MSSRPRPNTHTEVHELGVKMRALSTYGSVAPIGVKYMCEETSHVFETEEAARQCEQEAKALKETHEQEMETLRNKHAKRQAAAAATAQPPPKKGPAAGVVAAACPPTAVARDASNTRHFHECFHFDHKMMLRIWCTHCGEQVSQGDKDYNDYDFDIQGTPLKLVLSSVSKISEITSDHEDSDSESEEHVVQASMWHTLSASITNTDPSVTYNAEVTFDGDLSESFEFNNSTGKIEVWCDTSEAHHDGLDEGQPFYNEVCVDVTLGSSQS